MELLAILFLSHFLQAAEPTDPPKPPPIDQKTIDMVEDISRALDSNLQDIVASRSGPHIGADLIHLRQIPEFSWADFYVIEGRLRKLQTNVYLIAAPMKFHTLVTGAVKDVPEDDWCSRAIFGIPPGDLPYFLWVEVNGREAMLKRLEQFGIESYEANWENLKRTGIPIQKSAVNKPKN